ncbi:MAG: hypothetical protein ACI9IP_002601 [Arcticibacterium sp.]|jgi:hypothetical protein
MVLRDMIAFRIALAYFRTKKIDELEGKSLNGLLVDF